MDQPDKSIAEQVKEVVATADKVVAVVDKAVSDAKQEANAEANAQIATGAIAQIDTAVLEQAIEEKVSQKVEEAQEAVSTISEAVSSIGNAVSQSPSTPTSTPSKPTGAKFNSIKAVTSGTAYASGDYFYVTFDKPIKNAPHPTGDPIFSGATPNAGTQAIAVSPDAEGFSAVWKVRLWSKNRDGSIKLTVGDKMTFTAAHIKDKDGNSPADNIVITVPAASDQVMLKRAEVSNSAKKVVTLTFDETIALRGSPTTANWKVFVAGKEVALKTVAIASSGTPKPVNITLADNASAIRFEQVVRVEFKGDNTKYISEDSGTTKKLKTITDFKVDNGVKAALKTTTKALYMKPATVNANVATATLRRLLGNPIDYIDDKDKDAMNAFATRYKRTLGFREFTEKATGQHAKAKISTAAGLQMETSQAFADSETYEFTTTVGIYDNYGPSEQITVTINVDGAAPTATIKTIDSIASTSNTDIEVTFSEALHADTLALNTVAGILSFATSQADNANGTGGSPVDLTSSDNIASIGFSGETLKIRLKNALALTNNKYVVLKFATNAIKDKLGNAIANTTVVSKQVTTNVAPTKASSGAITPNDADSNRAYSANDTITLKFSEAVKIATPTTNVKVGTSNSDHSKTFGTGATIAGVSPDSNGFATSWLITLKGTPTVVKNNTIWIAATHITDKGGKNPAAKLAFTVPAVESVKPTATIGTVNAKASGSNYTVVLTFSEALLSSTTSQTSVTDTINFLSVSSGNAANKKGSTLTAKSIAWNTSSANAPTLTITLPNSTTLTAGNYVYVELKNIVKDKAENAIAGTGITKQITKAAKATNLSWKGKLNKAYAASGDAFGKSTIEGNIDNLGDYKVKSISTLSPASPNHIVTIDSTKLVHVSGKLGQFTATIVLESPTKGDVTLSAKQFEVTKAAQPTGLAQASDSAWNVKISQIGATGHGYDAKTVLTGSSLGNMLNTGDADKLGTNPVGTKFDLNTPNAGNANAKVNMDPTTGVITLKNARTPVASGDLIKFTAVIASDTKADSDKVSFTISITKDDAPTLKNPRTKGFTVGKNSLGANATLNAKTLLGTTWANYLATGQSAGTNPSFRRFAKVNEGQAGKAAIDSSSGVITVGSTAFTDGETYVFNTVIGSDDKADTQSIKVTLSVDGAAPTIKKHSSLW